MQDFYNLCDVYMDAVFNPRCLSDPQVFQQEGWHYELDSADADMSIKGVVFNEMKGVYSQPDSVHYEQVQSQLFPDNNYASNSGGDPEVIPDLTYDKFKEFHGKFYHPSNARCAHATARGPSGAWCVPRCRRARPCHAIALRSGAVCAVAAGEPQG